MTGLPMQELPGGLGAVPGLQVTGIAAGFRRNPQRRDLALIVAPEGSKATGVFTQSGFAAAPVQVSKEHLAAQKAQGGFRALVINSGNANAATGQQGLEIAKETSNIVAESLSCQPQQVLVASTGVIGVQLSTSAFVSGVPEALSMIGAAKGESRAEGIAAAEAIMTTDTRPKTAALRVTAQQEDGTQTTFTIGGMAKGSGMIAPHMATMIAVLATDAPLEQAALDEALKAAVNVSFNKVTIDSDTSTNDSAYLISTGTASGELISTKSSLYADFVAALTQVCQDLTYQIAQDGEGATKVIVVDVNAAASEDEAEKAARAIADSPLVKTAIAGHDANWGRIAMALGKSGACFEQEKVSIAIMDMDVFVKGAPVSFSEEEALKRFDQRDEVHIEVDLAAGDASARIWTCDLTHDYIAINGYYRT